MSKLPLTGGLTKDGVCRVITVILICISILILYTGSADKVSPQHQISLRSNYDLSERLQFNLWLRYVSKVDFYHIPSYVTMDTKLTFKPQKNVELFLVGQNLLSQNHREFVSDFIPSLPTSIPRGIYVGAEWRF